MGSLVSKAYTYVARDGMVGSTGVDLYRNGKGKVFSSWEITVGSGLSLFPPAGGDKRSSVASLPQFHFLKGA